MPDMQLLSSIQCKTHPLSAIFVHLSPNYGASSKGPMPGFSLWCHFLKSYCYNVIPASLSESFGHLIYELLMRIKPYCPIICCDSTSCIERSGESAHPLSIPWTLSHFFRRHAMALSAGQKRYGQYKNDAAPEQKIEIAWYYSLERKQQHDFLFIS